MAVDGCPVAWAGELWCSEDAIRAWRDALEGGGP